LWRVYREDLALQTSERRVDSQYRWVVADYKKAARESQHHWVRLRELLATLAASLYRDQAKGFDPAVAMKFAVTKTRLAELRNNPLNPSSNQDQVSAAPQLSPCINPARSRHRSVTHRTAGGFGGGAEGVWLLAKRPQRFGAVLLLMRV